MGGFNSEYNDSQNSPLRRRQSEAASVGSKRPSRWKYYYFLVSSLCLSASGVLTHTLSISSPPSVAVQAPLRPRVPPSHVPPSSSASPAAVPSPTPSLPLIPFSLSPPSLFNRPLPAVHPHKLHPPRCPTIIRTLSRSPRSLLASPAPSAARLNRMTSFVPPSCPLRSLLQSSLDIHSILAALFCR